MARKDVRNLVNLQNSGSTARVLNLLSIWKRHQKDSDYAKSPVFQNRYLNRAIILKHRLRPNEAEYFDQSQLSATKIVFPIDVNDLKLGGRSIFIGQKNFAYLLEDFLGRAPDSLDLQLLTMLDALPTLDPFLLREELKRNGYQPAPLYFELSEADLKRIFAFVQSEIEPLIRMSLGGRVGLATQSTKFVGKILANALDTEFEPFRQVMRLDESEFAEGIFCWKGFLYYKWLYGETAAHSKEVITQVLRVMPRGPNDPRTRDFIEQERMQLVQAMAISADAVDATLKVYDKAYAELTKNENPLAFRDFLLSAPSLFTDIGERLGGLQHVTSFWQYRFPPKRYATVDTEELLDLFRDFDSHLHVDTTPKAQSAA